MIRDQALVLSGRFAAKMFGPPVMPPQPEGIWRSVYSDAKWITAKGDNRYRRAIYTYWKRTSGYPGLTTFDVPSREVCTARRIVTNTPLQALVTLNDEAYVECAEGFANRAVDRGRRDGGGSNRLGLPCCYWPRPVADTLADLVQLHQSSLEEFNTDQEASRHLAPSPEQAAMSIVTSAILNLDEVLSK